MIKKVSFGMLFSLIVFILIFEIFPKIGGEIFGEKWIYIFPLVDIAYTIFSVIIFLIIMVLAISVFLLSVFFIFKEYRK